ncbi:PREDICTED: 4-coumarate--CoA ligase 1-like [Habropoda laboriosa]|uniref:4-coumarate--CoA ligase 1-like n=1 Tax=Habropoda laboriosa TaxID=597456 RepID=UPI00083DE174|nr:PREDICTED: 4-coumarate--CoA ligase 1-like [Habropoda laboriosa]
MTANDTQDNVEPLFKIENNVLKGKLSSCDTQFSSVGKLLLDTLRSNPDVIGQVDTITGAKDSFANIADRAVRCALWMQKQGVGKGDIVTISSHNHLDAIVPFLAALFLGAIVNPWDYEMNIQLARHFMTLVQPKVIFANEKSAGVAMEAAKIEFFHPIMVSFGDYLGTTSISEILKGHDKSAVDQFSCNEVEDSSKTALILFSSGTTGLPKGVQLPQRALLNMLQRRDSVNLSAHLPLWFSSLYWVSASLLILTSLYSRSTRILAPEFDEKTTCEIVEKFQVTWMLLSTSMSNRFARFNRLHDYNLSSLKILFTGGASLNKESQDLLRKQLPHTTILQAYGMTELGGLVSSQLANSSSGSCGVVNANCEIKIVDPETGKMLGANQNGELCAKSATMMTGYYKNPEATKNIMDKDGWLHSGDLGYYTDNGEIFIVDRLKEIIKYRGQQITPNVIENLLQSHPAVLEVAVVSIPHPTDDEHPIAFVSKVNDKDVTAEELMQMVASNLMDHYKLRGGVKFLPKLPHTHSGKISRKELKAIAKSLAVH